MKERENNEVECDCCGLTFPNSHMSDTWAVQNICGYCADRIEEDYPAQTFEIFEETF